VSRRTLIFLLAAIAPTSPAQIVHIDVTRREPVLRGRAFGAAGAYEKLVGKVRFAYDPALPANQQIVDLALAPRNADGRVECVADFYMLKPVDPSKGNGGLLYEVANRGGKGILAQLQLLIDSIPNPAGGVALISTIRRGLHLDDPVNEADFGDGWLMKQGFTILWMGWQWDVPAGSMHMDMPIATDGARPITGLVRGNFIQGRRTTAVSLADRGHLGYAVLDSASAENVMTVRANRTDEPQVIPHSRWRFTGNYRVSLDSGFQPGMIYDVVYRAKDPRVVGLGLAGARDLVSFLKYDRSTANPMPTIRYAIAWGISQSGRYLRHFTYEGFNADVAGRRVFDGMVDERGGSGRGSFNHRFAQASRDALEHFNLLYPVDMFPFTDGPETDPLTGQTDGLLSRAAATNTEPKFFHILSSSEYFNRAGSLTHTDPAGVRDAEIPASSRIYLISSSPHGQGLFPARLRGGGQSLLNPMFYDPVDRALFHAMDQWITNVAPPNSRYPRIADGTLVPAERGGWPAIPGIAFPPPQLTAYHLDFGPRWGQGIVDNEPPKIGAPFVVLVPAVDADGNDRAGIRVPDVAVPLGTYFGWNYRDSAIGAPRHLNGENGSYLPFPLTRDKRAASGDTRLSIEERYASKAAYLEKVHASTNALVADRFLLAEDTSLMMEHASYNWDWARKSVDPLYWWAAAIGLVVLSLILGAAYAVWRTFRWLWRRLFISTHQRARVRL
jgi:hypothetical protein